MKTDRVARALLTLASLLAAAAARAADQPLRLDEAVQLALARSESAKIADEQVNVSHAAVERARAGFLPVLSVNAGETLRLSGTDRNGAAVSGNLGTATATLSQPLVNAPAWPLYGQARQLLDAQRFSSADEKRLLSFNAATAFFQTLSAEKVLEAARHRFDAATANLAYAQARVDEQLNSSNDVTRASLSLATSAQETATDTGTVERAYIQLGFIIDTVVRGPLAPPDATLKAAVEPLPAIDELIAVAVEKRPDLIASKHSAQAAHLFAEEPLLRLIPTIGLAAAATGTTATSSTGRALEPSLAATASWTLYDAGIRYADKHSRDASARIADLQRSLLQRSAATDVRNAVASVVAAQNALRAAAGAVASSRKNVEETATLYRQGLAKAIELTDATDSRFVAEVGYASAELSMALAYLALRQAMGLDPVGTELR
jgi:outer membrane protein TolC